LLISQPQFYQTKKLPFAYLPTLNRDEPYLWVALAGFGYFGTGSMARSLRSTFVYQILVEAPLSRILGDSNSVGITSGKIVRIISSGEIKYKPSESFVFYPADVDQVFTGRTVVSTGPNSEIVISLGDGSYELNMKANSTVVIDGAPPLSEDGEVVAPLKVEVVSGNVSAEAMKNVSGSKQPTLQMIDVEEGTSTEVSASGQRLSKDLSPDFKVEAAESVRVEKNLSEEIQAEPPVAKTVSPPQSPKVANPPDTQPEELVISEGELPFEESKEGFTQTVEKSMNDVFQTELRRVNCGALLELRSEVMLTYLENDRLRAFLKKWATQIRKHGCK